MRNEAYRWSRNHSSKQIQKWQKKKKKIKNPISHDRVVTIHLIDSVGTFNNRVQQILYAPL